MLLDLRPGLAADAVRLFATLLEFAETASESGIADPDYGAWIADAVGLQGYRGRIVGDESAHEPRGQHGARNRFQFAAPHFLFRPGALQLLKTEVDDECHPSD